MQQCYERLLHASWSLNFVHDALHSDSGKDDHDADTHDESGVESKASDQWNGRMHAREELEGQMRTSSSRVHVINRWNRLKLMELRQIANDLAGSNCNANRVRGARAVEQSHSNDLDFRFRVH
mmetsp:Transcript_11430/g.18806  ORF Transcript_11430/g.18806 Transcript_11430/m.18806 type:complete len:123 (-) Transcript_11430:2748-3116(-)